MGNLFDLEIILKAVALILAGRAGNIDIAPIRKRSLSTKQYVIKLSVNTPVPKLLQLFSIAQHSLDRPLEWSEVEEQT